MKQFIHLLICLGFFLLSFNSPASADPIRIVAANLTSGNKQSYDLGEGIRILQALKPDIALIQEWNYKDNSQAAMREFVDQVFGTEYSFFREKNAQIPNGVISRFPIIKSGEWDDDLVDNRDFAFARLDLPGDIELSATNSP
jgi:hypothetical protein